MSAIGVLVAAVLYVDHACPYCTKAQQLLDELKIEYSLVDVRKQENQNIWKQIQQEIGRKTVPQIYINKKHIGGCDDLYHLYYTGKLEKILLGEENNVWK